jgi:hypothetical protein
MLIVIGAFPGAVPMMTSFNLRADFSLSTYLERIAIACTD